MTKRTPIETSEDFVRALAKLFDEIGPETPDEVDEVLREAGHDPDEVAARMKSSAEQAIANSPFNLKFCEKVFISWQNMTRKLRK